MFTEKLNRRYRDFPYSPYPSHPPLSKSPQSVPKEICPFCLSYQIFGHKVVCNVPSYSCNVHRLYSDVSSFVSDVGNQCLLFLFFVRLGRGLLILLIFLKNCFGFYWFFCTDFLFFILLISSLIFITYFLLLTLICSSFSSFLRWKFRFLILDSSFLKNAKIILQSLLLLHSSNFNVAF